MKNLFDLSFSKFIAPTVAKVIYVLVMVMLGIFYVVMVVSAFRGNVLLGFLAMLVLGPLVAFLYLVLVRVGLESLLATIRTAQNTADLVTLASQGHLPGPSAYPSTDSQPAQTPQQDLPGQGPAS